MIKLKYDKKGDIMELGTIIIILIVAVIILIVFYIIGIYNKLVNARNKVNDQIAQKDVQ